jgi:ferredoxin-NADP reductase
MTVSDASGSAANASRDRGYHALRIRQVNRETADASSFVLEIPAELSAAYAYQPGQFLTFRVWINGYAIYRSYSMSSTPGIDEELAVTVKRVPQGAVSNWMNDSLVVGDEVEASAPAGVFQLTSTDRDVLAFAAGSGITPIFSILKSALRTTQRSVRLLYANRDAESVIFADELRKWETEHGERLQSTHHLDVDRGFADASVIEPYVEIAKQSESYVCGPGPFMDLVETTLLAGGVPAEQIHIERFTVDEHAAPVAVVDPVAAEEAAPVTESDPAQVTIELNGQTKTMAHPKGATILQTARQMGMSPPFSCESGSCATCMAMCTEGAVSMYVNDALFDDELAEGWILTCQSVPTSPTVHVIYGYEG